MNQDDLKKRVAQAAKDYVIQTMPKGQYLGVGTGSTANWFIDLLAPHRDHFAGVISSSLASTERLLKLGFYVVDANQLPDDIAKQCYPMPIYVDGADEITPQGHMIKGGGGALTREKIIASMAQDFICICDESKLVQQLGRFPLPVEIIPLAQTAVRKALIPFGGQVQLRLIKSGKAVGQPYLTDNKGWILDIDGLSISDPIALEEAINQIPGVISVGLFAKRKADVLLLGKADQVEQIRFAQQLPNWR